MALWLFIPLVCIFCLFFTACLRRYALASNLMDVPNARSSHSIPTPRGGGVAIVGVFLLTALYLESSAPSTGTRRGCSLFLAAELQY